MSERMTPERLEELRWRVLSGDCDPDLAECIKEIERLGDCKVEALLEALGDDALDSVKVETVSIGPEEAERLLATRGPKVVLVKNEPISFEEVRELAAECIEHPASHKIRHEFRVATNPENILRILDRLEELERENNTLGYLAADQEEKFKALRARAMDAEDEVERLKNKKCPHDLAREFLEGE